MTLAEVRHERAAHEHGAEHVGVEDAAVVVDGHVLDLGERADAGIVDDRVHVERDGVARERRHAVFRCHVERARAHRRVIDVDAGPRAGEHACTGVGERPDERGADAAARAGHRDHAAA